MDHVITFYAPVKAKDSIGDLVKTMTLQSGSVKGQRIFKNGAERIEANQQVGSTEQDFRIYDVRSQYTITQEWEFNVYSIENASNVKRYKVKGIEPEGRKNFLRITGEQKDN
jgi:hypothetical protein